MFWMIQLALDMKNRETTSSTRVSTSEVAQIQHQITKLKPTSTQFGECRDRYKETHKMTMTMIDGKVC